MRQRRRVALLGDAEVDDPRAVVREQDVGRLEVAVHQALVVDRTQPLGERGAQGADHGQGQRALLAHGVSERRPRHVGGGHPGPLGVGVGVDHLCCPEPAHPARRGHLAPEPGAELGVARQVRVDQLDRDGPPGPRTAQVDAAHPAGPELALDHVRPDLARILTAERCDWHCAPDFSSDRPEPASVPDCWPDGRGPNVLVQSMGAGPSGQVRLPVAGARRTGPTPRRPARRCS